MTSSDKGQLPEQVKALLQIYGIYRVLIALSLFIVYWLQGDEKVLGTRLPSIYIYTTLFYSAFSLLVLRLQRAWPLRSDDGLFASFLIDTLVLVLILHASGTGGVTGISLLCVITVASATIVLGNPLALSIASFFAIGLLADSLISSQFHDINTQSVTNSGFFSIFLMLTALGLGRFSKHLRTTSARLQETQREIAAVQQLNQLVVQHMGSGVAVIADKKIAVYNQRAADALELETSEPDNIPIPKPLLSLYQQWLTAPQRPLPTLMAFHEQQELQCHFIAASGEDKLYTLVFLEDAQKATRQAQAMKLASLGKLTASIAHEVRNPLSAIKHAAQLIQESDLTAEDEKLLGIIVKQSQRIDQIIEDIRGFAKQQKIVASELDLKPFLKDFVSAFNQQYGPVLKLDDKVEEALVNFEPSQLRQVLDNLCTNAIRYSVADAEGTLGLIKLHTMHNTGRLILAVQDFGDPVPEENVARLFEPFFTTEHKGSGLGLYICREICLNNNASLDYRYGGRRRKSFSILFAPYHKTHG